MSDIVVIITAEGEYRLHRSRVGDVVEIRDYTATGDDRNDKDQYGNRYKATYLTEEYDS